MKKDGNYFSKDLEVFCGGFFKLFTFFYKGSRTLQIPPQSHRNFFSITVLNKQFPVLFYFRLLEETWFHCSAVHSPSPPHFTVSSTCIILADSHVQALLSRYVFFFIPIPPSTMETCSLIKGSRTLLQYKHNWLRFLNYSWRGTLALRKEGIDCTVFCSCCPFPCLLWHAFLIS